MDRDDLTDKQYNKLLDSIFPIIMEYGPSHATMDIVASRLSMSKRTLYEIFESKDCMLLEVLRRQHFLMKSKFEEIFSQTTNVMEGLVKVIAFHQKIFSETNPAFFRDMDKRLRHLRDDWHQNDRNLNKELVSVIETGIRQGVFRKEIDYQLQMTLFRVQMESLKRMEEYFPPEITLGQAYRAISTGFLRTIATVKGLEVLDALENKDKEMSVFQPD